jgi:hypothetical protein
VLEIGVGSGLNLPLYGQLVTEVIGRDPSPQLIAIAEKHSRETAKPVSFLGSSAEAIPLDGHRGYGGDDVDDVFDPRCVGGALRDATRRKRGGELLFVEHGRAAEPSVARW